MSACFVIPEDLIDQHKAAEVIGVSVATLKTWRSRKPDLGYYQIFGAIEYSRAECVEFRRKSYRRVVPQARN